MKRTYVVVNIFWLVLSTAVCVESWSLKVGGLHNPGPGFLPFYTAILLGLLALISLLQTLKESEGPASEIWGGIQFGKLAILLGTLFLYVFLLDRLGFLLGTFLLLLVLFRIVEPYSWKIVLFSSLLATAATYFFFVILLESRLPRGFLGF
ncbi:MAG: tripartite tricarboxylate transporter TctB family protein [Thermodesulfobacteriota bacterium]